MAKRVPRRENLVVGLDIGTTKICAIVGEVTPEGVDIVGIGTAPSKGLRKGCVINIESTVGSIKRAVEEAELMAGCEIDSVYAGIAGGHIRGFNSHGIVAVKEREVTEADIERVIDAAKAVAIPVDREVIHILPQEFIIDDQDGIREPLGMSGVRLESKVHIVTGAVTSAQNIVKCAQKCALNVSDIVLEQLASALAVLSEDEKELGVALVDIGGGTTDIAIFHGGSIQHTSVVAIGGQHMTNDIAVGLRTPQEEAETIKKRWGCASTKTIKANETIEVPSIGGRKARELSRQILGDILEPRVVEIFELVQREIEKMKLTELLASGVVLTGGASLLPGMAEVAEEVIGLPVRLGTPQNIGGLVDVVKSPMYATGVGLLVYGAQQMHDPRYFRARDENIYTKVKKRMSAWLEDVL
ncbi:MAG: cell division protein FtsA [Deltaproteobacteria bacterium]|nr:cell division protein FtsA [Deltaproteobacteria bacterium]